jgi:hypothetical protein
VIRWFGATDPHGPKRATRRLRREPGEKARPVSCFLGNGRGGCVCGCALAVFGTIFGFGGSGDRGSGVGHLQARARSGTQVTQEGGRAPQHGFSLNEASATDDDPRVRMLRGGC